jgi:predicted ATPase/DNA-binding SARP family transcriptional activator
MRTRKDQWLLALLALRPGAEVARTWLAGTLWPESAEPAALANLRNALKDLRRALGPEAARLRCPTTRTFALDLTGAALDVREFDTAVRCGDPASLQRAVDLYRGPLLEDCAEEWAFPERQAREQAYLGALEALAAGALAEDDPAAAERYLRRAIAVDRLGERTYRALMQVPAAGGSYAAALHCYRELRLHLHRELNAEPDAETQTLFQQLRNEARRLSAKSSVVLMPRSRTAHRPAAGAGVADPGGTAFPLPAESPRHATPETALHNLPMSVTRFVGREEEIARLGELLVSAETRLITLMGPGGTGKTRLAIEVGASLLEAYHGAVWFVPLADLSSPQLIPGKIRDTLGLPVAPGVAPLEQMAAFLLSRQASLLLLDNFEHLVAEGAEMVRQLLERVPTLTCLVTSRQRLGLAGEREFLLTPLPVPGEGENPEQLAQCASVRLFVDRAQAVRPDFQVTPATAGAVARLCARLEGLPLAIELAAGRIGVLTPAQMVGRLSERFELLVSRQRDAGARHQSLRAALVWSYGILVPELQRFFTGLSVFRGGCSLEAAEAVCGGEGVGCQVLAVRGADSDPSPNTQHLTPALEYLEQLRECSLVQSDEAGGGTDERSEVVMRFRLLETLREFGGEQLGPEERVALAHRHASYYLALAERAEPELVRAEQMAWLDRLERDLDNLRAALAWLGASGRIQEALRLGGALRRFWYARGGLVEGLEWLKQLLALPGAEARTSARAKALNAAGLIAGMLGHRMAARSLSEESLAIGRELGDRWNTALALTGMGYTVSSEGNLAAARSLLEEGLTIWREVGDLWGIDRALHALGWVAFSRRDFGAARAICQECLRVRRERGDRWAVANQLYMLGAVAREEGDYAEARRCAEQSLSLAREFGDRHSISLSLHDLGQVAYLEGDLPAARPLLEQSLALAREIGDNKVTGRNLIRLAEVVADGGDPDAAGAYLEEAVSLGWEPGDSSSAAWSPLQQGRIALRRGDPLAARRCFVESLARAQAVGSNREIVNSLEGLAAVAAGEGQPIRASRLFAAAAALWESDGRPLAPIDHLRYESRRAAVRAALGEGAFAAAWEEGRAMTPDEAVSLAVA